jgi:hypothetical protein
MSCPEQASVRTVYMPEAHQNEAVKQENGLLNICSPMVGVFIMRLLKMLLPL